MIGLLHGYLLEGSGSNLWTRAVVRSLCEQGSTVHLFCQDPEPEAQDFIAEAYRHDPDGGVETLFQREVPYPGRCIMHRPQLGDTLPVYVVDRYKEPKRVVPMTELPDQELEDYVERNHAVVSRVVEREGITALHANHAVLQSVVARRVADDTGVPYAVMPHGSALEYAVKRDPRLHHAAAEALDEATRIVVIGDEMRERVTGIFPELPDLGAKMFDLNLGVDTRLFRPLERAARPRAVERLLASLEQFPRGKDAERKAALYGALERADHFTPELRSVMERTAHYEGKRPDSDVEETLRRVDWEHDPVLLFVGRLIAAKGAQSVIAALPRILEHHPRARLIVVGHGPLREPLEGMVSALRTGRRRLFMELVAGARALEGEPDEPLGSVRAFVRGLGARGELDAWFDAAREHLREDSVLFTGYLAHQQLRYLFPCCDVAVFPSLVREAGPMVFLEALASGCFPLGTDFGGMAASIEAVERISPEAADGMRIRPDDEHLVDDIARQASRALDRPRAYAGPLRRLVEERYDWRSVAHRLEEELESMPGSAVAR